MVHKIVEILSKLNDLINREAMPDSIILEVISITLPTFFVEGIHSIQLASLNVVRSVFSRYEPHRNNILEDVFNSLVKLPKTKRNLRNYKLYDQKKSIQMVSALVMQLIQCCTALPKRRDEDKDEDGDEEKAKGIAEFVHGGDQVCKHVLGLVYQELYKVSQVLPSLLRAAFLTYSSQTIERE